MRACATTAIWTADLEGGTAVALTESRVLDGVQPEVVSFPSADGRTISGLLYRPAGNPPGAAIVHIHGGPEEQARPVHDPLIQALVRDGFAVLAPNIRGSLGYGLRFQRRIYRDWGGGDLEDLAGAAAYLRDASWCNSRLGVYGGSYGGFAALSCVTRLPDLWRAGVAVCGPSDLVSFAETFPPHWRYRRDGWIGDPADPDDRARLAARSPLHHVDQIQAPLLLVHGTNDARVAVGQSDRVHARLVELGRPVEYIRLEGEGHATADTAARDRTQARVIGWFREHLGG